MIVELMLGHSRPKAIAVFIPAMMELALNRAQGELLSIFCIGALTVLVVLGGGVEGFCRLTVFILSKKGLVWALNALALLLLIAGSILRIGSA